MSETQLLNLLNHYLIREFQEKGLEGMCTNEFLPLCAALVYPYRNEKIELTKDVITPIITSVQNFTRKKDLAQYSLQGLRSYFKVNWLPKLFFDEQKQLLKCVSLIVKIEDTGYFSIKDNEKVHNAYLNLPNLPNISGNYREESYETVPPTQVESNSTTSYESQTAHPVNQLEDTTLVIEKQPIEKGAQKQNRPKVHNREMKSNKPTENHPFCELYNKLLQKRGDAPTYTWQWLLTKDEYNDIKECVQKNPIPSQIELEAAKLLALCLGEYYKREYRCIPRFLQLDQAQQNAIIAKSGIRLYPSDSGRDARFYSICVDGGLPIYQTANTNSSYFIQALARLMYKYADEQDIEQGEVYLTKSGFSKALIQSYKDAPNGSIREYILNASNEDRVWHESDDTDENFQKVQGLIDKGKEQLKKRQAEKNKIWVSYVMTSYAGGYMIRPILHFYSEYDSNEAARHYAISEDRLKGWGVSHPDFAYFSLELERLKDSDPLFSWNFRGCLNGDYIEKNQQKEFELPWTEIASDTEWSKIVFSLTGYRLLLNLPTSEKPNDISDQLPIDKKGYVQLYTDTPEDSPYREWISANAKGNRDYRYSCLLYNATEWDTPCGKPLSGHVYIAFFREQLILRNKLTGKEIYFTNKGRITANLMNPVNLQHICSMVKRWFYDANSVVSDAPESPFLICENPELEVLYKRDNEPIAGEPEISFRSGYDNNAEWEKYTPNKSLLPNGLIYFKTHYLTNDVIVPCFKLNIKENEVADIFKPKTIGNSRVLEVNIDNISPSDVTAEPCSGISTTQSGKQINIYDNSNVNASSAEMNVVIKFPHGDSLHVTTYRPLSGKAILTDFGTTIIERYSTIPVIFSNWYNVTVFSEKECHKDKLSEHKELSEYLIRCLAPIGNDKSGMDKRDLRIVHDSFGDYYIVPYTKKIDIKQEDVFKSLNIFFMPFAEPCTCVPVVSKSNYEQIQKGGQEGLLFQSLRDMEVSTDYYMPLYISGSPSISDDSYDDVKKVNRQKRLREYAKEKVFAEKQAILHFKTACDHKLYFGVFDTLLSMIWNIDSEKIVSKDGKKKTIAKNTTLKFEKPKDAKKITDRALKFLNAYTDYSGNLDIEGLNRLAWEFGFSWKTIIPSKMKKDANFQYIYQQLN